MSSQPLAFPVKLRPVAVRRHRRVRRRVLAALAMGALAAVFLLRWRVESVAVSACRGLPQAALVSLRSLSGTPIVLLSLDGVRRLAEVWPGVDSVEARLELPGRLVVAVHPSPVAGSFATGRGWHAVGPDGTPGGRLEGPAPPVLEQFPTQANRLREGLVIAQRLAAETGRQVRVVRRILPGDLEVRLAGREAGLDGPVLHVRPAGSRAEAWWTARLRRGQTPGRWADLRRDDRAVVGGQG
ncbi:MAG: hypothetical protein GXP47_11895 [Acidobacteria bacterium]|nr:hypothetical protein [Acidobacteriota bacterium]